MDKGVPLLNITITYVYNTLMREWIMVLLACVQLSTKRFEVCVSFMFGAWLLCDYVFIMVRCPRGHWVLYVFEMLKVSCEDECRKWATL